MKTMYKFYYWGRGVKQKVQLTAHSCIKQTPKTVTFMEEIPARGGDQYGQIKNKNAMESEGVRWFNEADDAITFVRDFAENQLQKAEESLAKARIFRQTAMELTPETIEDHTLTQPLEAQYTDEL